MSQTSWFRVGYYPPIIENQMEKNMENEVETITQGSGFRV